MCAIEVALGIDATIHLTHTTISLRRISVEVRVMNVAAQASCYKGES